MVAAMALMLWATASAIAEGVNTIDTLALGFAVVVGVVLPAWMLLATDYRVERDDCRVRSGPFRWTIPVSEIQSVRPTRNPRSSPALSLDRLEITYGGGRRLLVSPLDKDGFLSAIEKSS
jgi:hypothetical protein